MLFTKKIEKRFAAVTLVAYALSTLGMFVVGGSTAYAAEAAACTTITLKSNLATKTAGYTQINPVLAPLATSSYEHALGASNVTQAVVPPWVDPAAVAPFATSGAVWISTGATWPGGALNIEGSSSLDQWRLYQDEFTIPLTATGTTEEVWYTADNASAVYQNGALVDMTGSNNDVFGTVPTTTPAHFMNIFHTVITPTAGTNTVNFVVRNWGGDYTANPTGLLYTAVVHYCVPTPASDVTVAIAKYIDGAQATASSSQGKDFSMSATWNAANIGSGTGLYTLGAGNTPLAYQTATVLMNSGAAYATNEVVGGTVVGVSCASGTPFVLSGYTTGDSFAQAATGTPTTTVPSFTNITSNKFVIVWNTSCPIIATTTPPTTGSLTVKKIVSGGTATSSDFMIHVMQNGVEIVGSPSAGSSTGITYAGLASSTYVVSETGSSTANYTSLFSGDCTASGTVLVIGSSTKNCIITNVFTPTTTPPVVHKHDDDRDDHHGDNDKDHKEKHEGRGNDKSKRVTSHGRGD